MSCFVSEPLAHNRIHERIQPLECVACDVSLIQPEGKFVNVPGEVLLADLMVDSVQPTLEDRPNASQCT